MKKNIFPYQNVVKQVSPKDFLLPPSPSRVQGRIVTGNRAALRQFPYQVSIRATSGTTTSICGGSIISTTFILTAAHCTKSYGSFEIGFGSNFLSSPLLRKTSVVKIEHPNYNANTLSNVIKWKFYVNNFSSCAIFSGYCVDKAAYADKVQFKCIANSTSEQIASDGNIHQQWSFGVRFRSNFRWFNASFAKLELRYDARHCQSWVFEYIRIEDCVEQCDLRKRQGWKWSECLFRR